MMNRSYWEIGLHVTIWMIVFLLISPEPLGIGMIRMGGLGAIPLSFLFFYSLLIDAGLVYTYQRRFLPRYFQDNRFVFFLLGNLAFLGGFVLFKALLDWSFSLWLRWLMTAGQDTLLFEVFSGTSGITAPGELPASLGQWLMLNLFTTAIILFLANMYGFIVEWWRARNVHHRLEREKLVMELTALKHQINPHFLFNVLNSLYALALKNDDEPTANGIEQLSRMMRYVLYESNGDQVSLEQELSYIQNYIDLQKLRVGKKVRIDLVVEGETQGRHIAPMLFIPFIENAFKHGISAAGAEIMIRIEVQKKELKFWVTNPMRQKVNAPGESDYGGIGLDNVRKRLDLLYPNRYQLSLETRNHQYQVHLKLSL